MITFQKISLIPEVYNFWEGFGYNFENFLQVIHELIDNSISHYLGNNIEEERRKIYLTFINYKDYVHFKIQDFGNGIENIEESLKIGSKYNQETVLNEHGFGLKQALSASDSKNSSWKIYTRTKEDVLKNQYKFMSAPYDFFDFKIFSEEGNCFNNTHTGTLIQFDCTKEWFNSVLNDFKSKNYNFKNILNLLKENLGVYYSNIIENEKIEIIIHGFDTLQDTHYEKEVKSIFPVVDEYIDDIKCNDNQLAGKQSIIYDLGDGEITLEYYFAWIKDHSETQRYYKKNMESSGIEIRINGRYIEHMQFKEVWGNKAHPNQNGLLIWMNLVSSIRDRLPTTRTTKTGLNKSDSKVSKMKEWLKDKVSNISQLESELLKDGKLICLLKSQVDLEYYNIYKFIEETSKCGRLIIVSYINDNKETDVYFLCEKNSMEKDLYNIEYYCDDFNLMGYSIKNIYFIAKDHSDEVVDRTKYINSKVVNNYSYDIQLKILDETK